MHTTLSLATNESTNKSAETTTYFRWSTRSVLFFIIPCTAVHSLHQWTENLLYFKPLGVFLAVHFWYLFWYLDLILVSLFVSHWRFHCEWSGNSSKCNSSKFSLNVIKTKFDKLYKKKIGLWTVITVDVLKVFPPTFSLIFSYYLELSKLEVSLPIRMFILSTFLIC